MDLTGYDKRDFIKLKILFYLRSIREQEKGKDVDSTFYKSAGQVSKGTGVSYETCRAFLLQRWNSRNWTQWYKKKTGEKGKRIRSGFGFVEVIDMKTLDGNADYRYGFRITDKGLKYLVRAKKKSQSDKLDIRLIWEKKYNTAYEQVVRINSPILDWVDQLAKKCFISVCHSPHTGKMGSYLQRISDASTTKCVAVTISYFSPPVWKLLLLMRTS